MRTIVSSGFVWCYLLYFPISSGERSNCHNLYRLSCFYIIHGCSGDVIGGMYSLNGADGYQPYLISPEKGLRFLIKGVLELAKEPSRLCVDELHRVLVGIVSDSANATRGLGRYPPFKREKLPQLHWKDSRMKLAIWWLLLWTWNVQLFLHNILYVWCKGGWIFNDMKRRSKVTLPKRVLMQSSPCQIV